MKKLNLWKTLFCTAMVLGAFTACSNDDSDDGNGGIPEITVDGGTSTAVAHDLTAGLTSPVVTVISNANWVVSYSGDGAQWCTPVAQEGTIGKKGTVKLAFNLAAATSARETTVTLTASGSFQGIPLNPKVTITVKQNAGGSTSAETNVAAVRTLLKAMNPTATKADVSAEIAAMTLTAIVCSDQTGSNTTSAYDINVEDSGTAANSGLMLNGTYFNTNKLAPGTVISVALTGAKVGLKNGMVQLSISNDITPTTTPGTAPAPIVITPDQIPNYESQFVKIEKCEPTSAAVNTAWNNTTNKGNVNFVLTSDVNTTVFIVRTGSAAAFKDQVVPEKSGYIQGIASIFNTDSQILPRVADDLAGLTQDYVAPTTTTATISKITAAGDYKVVDATVIATYAQGFLMNDGTGTILVYQGASATVPAVNKKVEVEGTVSLYGGFYQFGASGLTVKETGTGSYTAPAITALDGAAMDALQAAPVIKLVKFTGTLAISGTTNKYYNVTVAGTTTVKSASITYPATGLLTDAMDGKVIDVEGWYIGHPNTNKDYFNVMATKVTENTTVPTLSITTTPKTFAATADATGQVISFNSANLGTNKVFAKLSGTGAGQFTLSASELTGSSVTVTTIANSATTAQTATLTIYAAASADGAVVVMDEVTLTQDAKASENQTTISLDFKDNPYKIATDYVKTETQYTMADYTFTLFCASNGFKYNSSTNALLFGKLNAYIEFPAIEGKKLVKIVVTSNSGAAAGQTCGIYTTADAVVEGGAALNWSKTDENTYTLTNTAVNTKYRMKSTTSSNCQINTLVLTYN